jgi:hypothetical protein
MRFSWDAADVLRAALAEQEPKPNPDADIAAGRVTRFEDTETFLKSLEPKPDGAEGEPLIPMCRCGGNYVEQDGHLVCPNCREFVEPKEGEEGEEAH